MHTVCPNTTITTLSQAHKFTRVDKHTCMHVFMNWMDRQTAVWHLLYCVVILVTWLIHQIFYIFVCTVHYTQYCDVNPNNISKKKKICSLIRISISSYIFDTTILNSRVIVHLLSYFICVGLMCWRCGCHRCRCHWRRSRCRSNRCRSSCCCFICFVRKRVIGSNSSVSCAAAAASLYVWFFFSSIFC